MQVTVPVPTFMPARPAAPRSACARVEAASRIPRLTRHHRTGSDHAHYAPADSGQTRPYRRGQLIDVFV